MSFLLRRGIISSALAGTSIYSASNADFNGVDEYLETTSAAELQLPTNMEFSFEASVKLATVSGVHVLISKYDEPTHEYHLTFNGTSLYLRVVNGASVAIINQFFSYVFSTATQYHIVLTCDASDLKLYIDGALEETIAWTYAAPKQSTSAFTIGAYTDDHAAFPYYGTAGIIRKYDSTLSLANVQTNYNSGDILCSDLAFSGAVFDADLAEWAGRITPLVDNTGNGNTLTNYNTTPFTGTGLSVLC